MITNSISRSSIV